jgi:hypothetical protein
MYGNRMGVSPTGERRANRIDVWWDGQGRNNCWQEVGTSEPVPVPRCGTGGAPAGPGADRFIAEPGKVLKLYECNTFDLQKAQIPGNCDWFGARGLERVEVQAATIEAVLLVALAALLWWRRVGAGRLGAAGLAALVAGAIVGVFGTAAEGSPLTGIGLVLLGAGWIVLGLALRARGTPRFGWYTVVLGAVAALNGVDRWLWMLPWIPVPPSWIRILLELGWLPWALVLVLRRARPGRSRAPAAAPATADVQDRERSGETPTPSALP